MHQPKTVAEASQMLAEFGEKGRLYAGGTELLLAMKHDLLRYEHLIDVKTIPGLNKIELKNGTLSIGGTATHRAIEHSPVVQQNLPVMAQMERERCQRPRARQRHAWRQSLFRRTTLRSCDVAAGARSQSSSSGAIRKTNGHDRSTDHRLIRNFAGNVMNSWKPSRFRYQAKANVLLI